MADHTTLIRQTEDRTPGNRLTPEHTHCVQASMSRANGLNSGHRACQGCGEALAARVVLDAALAATDGQLITVNATGCLEVFSTPYPESAWQVPWIHSLFGNAPAVAAGVAAAMKARQRSHVRVLAEGGDGGTADIGFGCLSGMFDRNDDVLYVCYDNEAYMNTGVQRSSCTPPAARTATTPPTGAHPGNPEGQGKNLPRIAIAHGVAYVATASADDIRDLEAKVRRAMEYRGARYIHVHVPCPLGWGSAPHDTVRLARLGVECGLLPIFQAEHGEITAVRRIRQRATIHDYLKPQKRFAHLFKEGAPAELLQHYEAAAEANIAQFGLLEGQ